MRSWPGSASEVTDGTVPEFRHLEETHMQPNETTGGRPEPGNWGLVALAWIAVGIPLGWGVFMTFKKAVLLFH